MRYLQSLIAVPPFGVQPTPIFAGKIYHALCSVCVKGALQSTATGNTKLLYIQAKTNVVRSLTDDTYLDVGLNPGLCD